VTEFNRNRVSQKLLSVGDMAAPLGFLRLRSDRRISPRSPYMGDVVEKIAGSTTPFD
jgi:hypothetical protein